jgi:S-formylglutathione hydrolase FrmB
MDDVTDVLLSHMDELGSAGLFFDTRGHLAYNEFVAGGFDFNKLRSALDGLAEAAEKIYNKTTDFLTVPLSEHMSFYPLSYYYDYRLGGIAQNMYEVVSSGLIVDVAI